MKKIKKKINIHNGRLIQMLFNSAYLIIVKYFCSHLYVCGAYVYTYCLRNPDVSGHLCVLQHINAMVGHTSETSSLLCPLIRGDLDISTPPWLGSALYAFSRVTFTPSPRVYLTFALPDYRPINIVKGPSHTI